MLHVLPLLSIINKSSSPISHLLYVILITISFASFFWSDLVFLNQNGSKEMV